MYDICMKLTTITIMMHINNEQEHEKRTMVNYDDRMIENIVYI